MLKLLLAFPLVASLFLVTPQSQPARAAEPAPAPACADTIPMHPVLVHDVAGSTLIGPIYRHLVVYSNGHAHLSATTYEPDPGRAQTGILTLAEVAQLRADLASAGAFTSCDNDLPVSDVPVTTVSVFRGATNALAHTYSFLAPDAQQAAVEAVVQQLVATKFPNF